MLWGGTLHSESDKIVRHISQDGSTVLLFVSIWSIILLYWIIQLNTGIPVVNLTKTQVVWLGSGQQLAKMDTDEMSLLASWVHVLDAVWNLGVIFDSQLSDVGTVGTVCLNSFGNQISLSDNSNDRWKRLCLVSWAMASCVWTLRALIRNLVTYLQHSIVGPRRCTLHSLSSVTAVLPPRGQHCGTVCLNSFGNQTSLSDNSNDRWKCLCLVSWAVTPCVWTLRALTRNLLTYFFAYLTCSLILLLLTVVPRSIQPATSMGW